MWPDTPWWISSQPSSTRMGGGPAPILSSSNGYADNATSRWLRRWTSAPQVAVDVGDRDVRHPDAGSVVGDPGRQMDALARAEPARGPTSGGAASRMRVRRLDRARVRERRPRPCSGTGSGPCRDQAGTRSATARAAASGAGRSTPPAPASVRAVRRRRRSSGGRRAWASTWCAGPPPRRWTVRVPSPRPERARSHAARPDRHTVVEDDLGEPDAGDVPVRDETGKQMQSSVRVATTGGVEDTFGLEVVAGLGCHHHTEAGERVRDGGCGAAGRGSLLGQRINLSHCCRDRWTRTDAGREGTAPRPERPARTRRRGSPRTGSTPALRRCSCSWPRRPPAAACRPPW